MGLISGKNAGKDIFNAKWITAIICNAADRMYFVPIKHVIGDYFLAEIEKEIFCFRLKGARVKTFRSTAAKTFRAIIYDTEHYLPVSAGDQKQLEDLLRNNALPKVTNRLFGILKFFSKKEKELSPEEEFSPHSLKKLAEELAMQSDEYADEVQNIRNYLDHLSVDQIVTPVKKVVEYLEGDFLATDPRFFGSVMSLHLNLELEHKKLTNSPITAKKPLIKIMVLGMLFVMLALVVYYAYSNHMFDNLLPHFEDNSITTTGVQCYDDPCLQKQFPNGAAIKAAVDSHSLDYNRLPPIAKQLVDEENKKPKVTIPAH